MSTVLDRVPVDEIGVAARDIRFARTLLTVFAGVFFAAGWLAGRAWLGVAWAAAAVKVGWLEARRPRQPDSGSG